LELFKRPEHIVDFYAGRFTYVFPDPRETQRFLAEERASWNERD
jgi:hypothetical protein